MYAIITENDVSQWEDQTGKFYHFPVKYKRLLTSGTNVIYYKGIKKQKGYNRLSPEPHYFGTAQIGEVKKIEGKNEFIATIENYKKFDEPILAKKDGVFLEVIPENRLSNYWRDGVRFINEYDYNRILNFQLPVEIKDPDKGFESEFIEGKKKVKYGTTYERNRDLRKRALEIHGYTCKACNMNFGDKYGDKYAKFIHIHHVKPISERGEALVNPVTDLVPVCPNCHWIIHSESYEVLSIETVKKLLLTQAKGK